MIENKIYYYLNGLLKRNTSKKTIYIVGNKKFTGKIYILSLSKKRKRIFARDRKKMKFAKVKEDRRGNGQDYD